MTKRQSKTSREKLRQLIHSFSEIQAGGVNITNHVNRAHLAWSSGLPQEAGGHLEKLAEELEAVATKARQLKKRILKDATR